MSERERDRGEVGASCQKPHSQDHVSPLLQLSISISLHLPNSVQPALHLQPLCAAQHHLAAPLVPEQVLKVPGGSRVADLQHRVDLGSRDGQLRN